LEIAPITSARKRAVWTLLCAGRAAYRGLADSRRAFSRPITVAPQCMTSARSAVMPMKVTSSAYRCGRPPSRRRDSRAACAEIDLSRFRAELDGNCGGNRPPRHLAGPLDDPVRERELRPSALHREQWRKVPEPAPAEPRSRPWQPAGQGGASSEHDEFSSPQRCDPLYIGRQFRRRVVKTEMKRI
jgi:hypothetical protein